MGMPHCLRKAAASIGGGSGTDYTRAENEKGPTQMKSAIIVLALVLATAGSALAGPCEDGLKKLDDALQSDQIAPDLKMQAEDMRGQAQQLCDAGNEEEGADVLSEAVALLGIE